jgi:hypothetical protein
VRNKQKPGYIRALPQKAGLLDDLGRTGEAVLAVPPAIVAFQEQFPEATQSVTWADPVTERFERPAGRPTVTVSASLRYDRGIRRSHFPACRR